MLNGKKFSNKKRMGQFVLSVLLFSFLLSLLPFGKGICFRNDDGEKRFTIPIRQDFFEVEFVHSVNKGRVIERYQIASNGCLELKVGWFESYGAGMVDTLEPNMSMREENGMLRIDFENRRMRKVTYQSSGSSGHLFRYGDWEMKMFERLDEKSLSLSIEDIRLFDYWSYVIERSLYG